MKQIVVLSGKGGTGKTFIVGCFAALAEKSVMIDCDVDAPNLHLIIDHEIIERGQFTGSRVARIDPQKCDDCRYCVQFCKFKAIRPSEKRRNESVTIRKDLCEGCGLCVKICPKKAIIFEDRINGEWYISRSNFGTLVHSLLEPGEQNSGKLVALLKQKGEQISKENGTEIILVDGPPGIGCPVLASMANADIILLVGEPTKSGLSDFKRIAELSLRFRCKVALILNRYDLNIEMAREIERSSSELGISLIGKIPFDYAVIEQMAKGKNFFECENSEAKHAVENIWRSVLNEIEDKAVRV